MGKVRDKLNGNRPTKYEFVLDESEFNYVKDLTSALNFHVLRNRLVAGFLTICARHHLPDIQPSEGHAFEFSIDLKGDSRKLTLVEVPIRED